MKHPYEHAAPYRRWRTGVAELSAVKVDPIVSLPFVISRSDRIVTAGSCFAQHIARHLRQRGYRFLETEAAHPILSADLAAAYGYGVYSARYGNIYTARQLLQLLQRAYGRFQPVDDVWEQEGRFFDPFRPGIHPGGYATRGEYEADRRQHFAAVRRALEELDYFLFTLGLTECWVSRQDGAVYPLCPGTIAGRFDPEQHGYLNQTVEEVSADMTAFIRELRRINPKAKIILSVSPVPLAATAEDRHVLVATSYSKAVLRVAAEVVAQLPDVCYFPAYEIITGAFTRGMYFASDLRSIREEGVRHVMDVFFRHACEDERGVASVNPVPADGFLPQMRELVDALCDEVQLDTAGDKA
jgi:hypothetical protein